MLHRDRTLNVLRQLQAAANEHDVDRIMTFYAPDAVAVSPVFSELTGRDAIAASWKRLFETMQDCTIAVSNVFVEDDRIAILGSITATDRVGWFGLPPTGGEISYRIVILCTVDEDGKIVREERVYDSVGVVERLEKALLDKELRTAADVQRALMSHGEHRGSYCEAMARSVPCRSIGGDFFQFIELASGDFGVVLGDVAGKGPPAALLAALLQGMFMSDGQTMTSPAATMARLNDRVLERRLEPRFATLVYGVLSPDGRFVYSNAGHNPPALLTRGGLRRLTIGGPPVGALAEARFDEAGLRLNARDTIVLFTDGVTEARNTSDEEFGEDRLFERIDAHATESPDALLEHIFDSVHTFCEGVPQADDVTAAVVRFGVGSRA